MKTRKSKIGMSALVLAAGLSGTAQAALQGRDLDGNLATFEAYYDTALNISWLADANYAQTSGYDIDGKMTWDDAVTWASNLSIVDTVHNTTYDNWRLPAVNPVNGSTFNYAGLTVNGSLDVGWNITSPNTEMAYMYYVNLGNLGYYTTSGTLTNCYGTSNACLDNVGSFTNLQASVYWSGTESVQNAALGWVFLMDEGFQLEYYKSVSAYAWAVTDGDVAAVPEADTWVMLLAGLGLVCFMARCRRAGTGKSLTLAS